MDLKKQFKASLAFKDWPGIIHLPATKQLILFISLISATFPPPWNGYGLDQTRTFTEASHEQDSHDAHWAHIHLRELIWLLCESYCWAIKVHQFAPHQTLYHSAQHPQDPRQLGQIFEDVNVAILLLWRKHLQTISIWLSRASFSPKIISIFNPNFEDTAASWLTSTIPATVDLRRPLSQSAFITDRNRHGWHLSQPKIVPAGVQPSQQAFELPSVFTNHCPSRRSSQPAFVRAKIDSKQNPSQQALMLVDKDHSWNRILTKVVRASIHARHSAWKPASVVGGGRSV